MLQACVAPNMSAATTTNDVELDRLRGAIVEPPDLSAFGKLTHRRARRAHVYHTAQNEHIDRLVRVAEDPSATRLLNNRSGSSAFHVKAAIFLSIYGTILVAGLQIICSRNHPLTVPFRYHGGELL